MKTLFIIITFISTYNVFYGQFLLNKGEYLSLNIGIESRGNPDVYNKIGTFHPEMFPSVSSSIGLTFQNKIRNNWYYSIGLNSSIHFDGIIYKNNIKSTDSSSDNSSFNAALLELNGIRLNMPLNVLYKIYDSKRFNSYVKLGAQIHCVFFRQSISSSVIYGFGNQNKDEEYHFNIKQESIPHQFEYSTSIGLKFEFKRFVYDVDLTHNYRYKIDGSYSLKHIINKTITESGFANYTTNPLSLSLTIGFKLSRPKTINK